MSERDDVRRDNESYTYSVSVAGENRCVYDSKHAPLVMHAAFSKKKKGCRLLSFSRSFLGTWNVLRLSRCATSHVVSFALYQCISRLVLDAHRLFEFGTLLWL